MFIVVNVLSQVANITNRNAQTDVQKNVIGKAETCKSRVRLFDIQCTWNCGITIKPCSSIKNKPSHRRMTRLVVYIIKSIA